MKTYRGAALLAALAGCFVLASARGAAAQVTAPPGSYKQTCSDIKMEGSTLKASCRGKGATTVDKVLGAGEPFYNTDPLVNFYECDGDIWNDNSKLTCKRNPNHARLKQARAALNRGALNVLNRELDDAQDYSYWLGEMFKEGLLPRFYAGMTDEDATKFFSKFLTRPEQSNRRAQAVEAAFKDVYGFGASPKDVAFWNAEMLAGRGGYQYIIFVESNKLNGDKVVRRLMITNAYRKAMGRVPKPGDYDYWQPRAETFKEVVAAARAYLYSPGGANDLAETVSRALEAKTGSKPSTEQVKEGVIRYSKTRAIFDEM